MKSVRQIPIRTTRRTFVQSAAVVLAAGAAQDSLHAGADTPPTDVSLPPVTLHGYGRISGGWQSLASGGSSITRIQCESAAKALLLQAKYLSDLERLPGVESVNRRHGGSSYPVYLSPTGTIVCRAAGIFVEIAASNGAEVNWQSLDPQHPPAPDQFKARAEVPMWLDRWDRHGLLCYFAPEATPPGSPYLDQNYDYADALRFVKEHNTGLVIWTYPISDDFAEACTSEQAWSWAQEGARKAGIPVHINTQINPPQLWLANRYPDQVMLKSPQFLGGYYGVGHDSTGLNAVSWVSEEAEDALLGVFQRTVRRFANDPNIVGWLEPHGETYEVPQKFFLESGPNADRAYSAHLKATYGSLTTLSRRWFGDANRFRAWSDVRLPEIAEFAGYGPGAIDLHGTWRVKYLPAPDGHTYTRDEARGLPSPPPVGPVPPEWLQPEFDDSGWGELTAPGNDCMLAMARSPLLYRRSFDIPKSWLGRGPVSLYVWDLANRDRDVTTLHINGKPIPETSFGSNDQHWSRFDISDALKPGSNHIALLMPRAIICYRVYISREPPELYPFSDSHRNAQWADLVDWNIQSRGAQIRRGAEMIRQVDAHRSINFMAANDYADPVKQACRDYGGRFHDTGAMAGFWTDENSLLMSGAGLPVTAEPGNGAPNEREFQLFWGRWLTEGVNGVHYFQNWGEIAWNPEVLRMFEANLPMYTAIGKYHAPFAKVAVLFSHNNQWLTGFPWQAGGRGGYYSGWNAAMHLINTCPRDGVGAIDFDNGAVDRYKVVIDSNSVFMDQRLIAGIDRYVRQGGVFVTYGSSGRSSPESPDTWPITRLTGYAVSKQSANNLEIRASYRQKVYRDAKPPARCSGLRLVPQEPGCTPLAEWEDGSIAIGMRKLGKGAIVQFGPEVSGDAFIQMITPILDHFGAAARVPAVVDPQRGLHLRHFISNCGLHDVWILFNESDAAVTTDIKFRRAHPEQLTDIVTGKQLQTTRTAEGSVAEGVELAKWQSRMFYSPRVDVAGAPLEWLNLQRGWWQGTAAPPAKRLPQPKDLQRFSLDLTEGWAFKQADGASDDKAAALAAPEINDAAWERRTLGMWLSPVDKSAKRIVMRRKFSVPAHWKDGEIALIADVPYAQFFHETRLFLNGKPWLQGRKTVDGPYFDTFDGAFKPGSTHLLALDIQTRSTLIGCRGALCLAWIPAPEARIELTGEWSVWSDPIHRSVSVMLPATVKAMYLSRSIVIPEKWRGKNIVVYYKAGGERLNLIFNGHLISHADQPRQHLFSINVTPRVQFGNENLIELAANSPDGEKAVQHVEIRIYDRAVYP